MLFPKNNKISFKTRNAIENACFQTIDELLYFSKLEKKSNFQLKYNFFLTLFSFGFGTYNIYSGDSGDSILNIVVGVFCLILVKNNFRIKNKTLTGFKHCLQEFFSFMKEAKETNLKKYKETLKQLTAIIEKEYKFKIINEKERDILLKKISEKNLFDSKVSKLINLSFSEKTNNLITEEGFKKAIDILENIDKKTKTLKII